MSALIQKLDKYKLIFSQFLSDYDVHFCRIDEIDDVIAFLDTYWKNGHVLVKSRKLMDWQYLDKLNHRYNFVIARYKTSKEIHALVGFIPTNHFDHTIKRLFVWGAIWKVRDDVAPAGLGVYLQEYLTTNLPVEIFAGFGISADAEKNNKSLGWTIKSAENYFFANPSTKEFKIAVGLEKYQKKSLKDVAAWFLTKCELTDYEKLSGNESVFESVRWYKSKCYYENRYFKHPFYNYECYVIKQVKEIKAFFFVRESPANGANCLRLVEYVGDYATLQNVQKSIANLLEKKTCEFMDIITSNVSNEVMQKANFINKSSDSSVVIPNYFEPFVQKNILMKYEYITLNKDFIYVVNKGDADQDRPSFIKD